MPEHIIRAVHVDTVVYRATPPTSEATELTLWQVRWNPYGSIFAIERWLKTIYVEWAVVTFDVNGNHKAAYNKATELLTRAFHGQIPCDNEDMFK